MGIVFAQPFKEPDVVLVPPIFERNIRGKGRMAKSSYDYQFSQPALRWLFNDYMSPNFPATFYFRPPEDPRMSLKGRLLPNIALGKLLAGLGYPSILDSYNSDAFPQEDGWIQAGSARMRYQRAVDDPMSFLDLKVAVQDGVGYSRLRGCYFDPQTGYGIFGSLPITETEEAVQLGARYSSPGASVGFVMDPSTNQLRTMWALKRYESLTAGVQVRHDINLEDAVSMGALKSMVGNPGKTLAGLWRETAPHTSFAIAYSPTSGFASGKFTAAVEVREQRQLLLSFLQHMVVQRSVRNPFEDDNVAGIVNYVNIGLQAAAPIGPGKETRASNIALAASWQANKNLMLKARAGTDSIAAALVFRSWTEPSFTLAASALWDFQHDFPRLGLTFTTENYGDLRYERSSGALRGGALVQRHVAQPEDLMNKEGRGVLVQKEDFDNPEILGQTPQPTEQYL